jgi:hypothetical protein
MIKTFLGKHFDEAGAEIMVYYSDKVTQSPALGLMFRTNAHLLSSNLIPAHIYWDDIENYKVVWAEDTQQNVLGGIAFRFFNETGESFLVTAFTDPSVRLRGISSKICFPYYIKKSKELGAVRTGAMTSINNSDIIKIKGGDLVSYQGRKPTYIVFVEKI